MSCNIGFDEKKIEIKVDEYTGQAIFCIDCGTNLIYKSRSYPKYRHQKGEANGCNGYKKINTEIKKGYHILEYLSPDENCEKCGKSLSLAEGCAARFEHPARAPSCRSRKNYSEHQKSYFHQKWQDTFPQEYREAIRNYKDDNDNILFTNRADIYLDKPIKIEKFKLYFEDLVIEIQHSTSISEDDIDQRMLTYKNLIWICDIEDRPFKIRHDIKTNIYSITFDSIHKYIGYLLHKNNHVFLDWGDPLLYYIKLDLLYYINFENKMIKLESISKDHFLEEISNCLDLKEKLNSNLLKPFKLTCDRIEKYDSSVEKNFDETRFINCPNGKILIDKSANFNNNLSFETSQLSPGFSAPITNYLLESPQGFSAPITNYLLEPPQGFSAPITNYLLEPPQGLPSGAPPFSGLPPGAPPFSGLSSEAPPFSGLPSRAPPFSGLPSRAPPFSGLPPGAPPFSGLPPGVPSFSKLPPGVPSFSELLSGVSPSVNQLTDRFSNLTLKNKYNVDNQKVDKLEISKSLLIKCYNLSDYIFENINQKNNIRLAELYIIWLNISKSHKNIECVIEFKKNINNLYKICENLNGNKKTIKIKIINDDSTHK